MFISTESMADKCTVIHNVHFVSFVTIVDCSIAGYTSTTWAQVMLVVYMCMSWLALCSVCSTLHVVTIVCVSNQAPCLCVCLLCSISLLLLLVKWFLR